MREPADPRTLTYSNSRHCYFKAKHRIWPEIVDDSEAGFEEDGGRSSPQLGWARLLVAAREGLNGSRAARLCNLDRAPHEGSGNPASPYGLIHQEAADGQDALAVTIEDPQSLIEALGVKLWHAFGWGELHPTQRVPLGPERNDAFGSRFRQITDERRAVQLRRVEQPVEPSVLVTFEVPVLTMAGRARAFEQAVQRLGVP
jgi:hypothetical protein